MVSSRRRTRGLDWVLGPADREPEPFGYLCRVTGLPPLVAQAAFDAVRLARADPGTPGRWHVVVPGGSIDLWSDGQVPPPPRPCFWSYREAPGTIRSPWWWVRVPVRLELVPWSSTRTTLGLSIRGRRHAGAAAYHRIGQQAVDVLAAELDGWALHELAQLDRRLAVG